MNIYGAITQNLGNNKYEVITSTGKRIQALNATFDYPVFVGDNVGVIQIGNEYCVFNVKAPLRSVMALDNPLEYGKLYPEQYFMAVLAHRLGNIKRLYEVWTAGYVNTNKRGSFTWARAQGGGNTSLKIADWIPSPLVEIGKPILVDTELNQVVGLLYEIKDATPYWCDARISGKLYTSGGAPITDDIEGSYTYSGADEWFEFSAYGGEFTIFSFLPTEITIKYSYQGNNYRYKFSVEGEQIKACGGFKGSADCTWAVDTRKSYAWPYIFTMNFNFKPTAKEAENDILGIERFYCNWLSLFKDEFPVIKYQDTVEDWSDSINGGEYPVAADVEISAGGSGLLTAYLPERTYSAQFTAKKSRRLDEGSIRYGGNALGKAQRAEFAPTKLFSIDHFEYSVRCKLKKYYAELI